MHEPWPSIPDATSLLPIKTRVLLCGSSDVSSDANHSGASSSLGNNIAESFPCSLQVSSDENGIAGSRAKTREIAHSWPCSAYSIYSS